MVILLQQKNFGPNVIYFALGITEGRPAGPFDHPGYGITVSTLWCKIEVKFRLAGERVVVQF